MTRKAPKKFMTEDAGVVVDISEHATYLELEEGLDWLLDQMVSRVEAEIISQEVPKKLVFGDPKGISAIGKLACYQSWKNDLLEAQEIIRGMGA